MDTKLPEERLEYILKSTNPFRDERGSIENYELPFPVNMANIITSRKGSLRANHYHPQQIQQVLLISGSYISVSLDLIYASKEGYSAKNHSNLINPGDLVVTPPMVAHTMIFLEDSVFLNLVGGNRDHDKFGLDKRLVETSEDRTKIHTIKYELVKPSDVEFYTQLFNYK